MTALLNAVRKKIDKHCLVKGGLKKEGCRVLMTDTPSPRLVIDFDKPGSPLPNIETRPDYLLIAESKDAHGLVAVLELKRSNLKMDRTAQQLQAGASAAEKLVRPSEKLRFRPVAVSSSVGKHRRNKLRRESITIMFHGQKEHIHLMKCGDKLTEDMFG